MHDGHARHAQAKAAPDVGWEPFAHDPGMAMIPPAGDTPTSMVHAALAPETASLLERGRRELQGGNARAAMASLDAALRLAPGHAEVLRWAGTGARELGQDVQAAAYYRRALRAAPTDPDLHVLLGIVLQRLGEVDAAINTLRHACELAPDWPLAWYNLGEMLRADGRVSEAVQALEAALAIDPDVTRVQLALARAYASIGRIDDAAAHLRDTLRRDPAHAEAWWSLADLKTVRLDAADIAQLDHLLARGDLAPDARVLLGFTLAHALEDHGDYARAFDVLAAANALQRRASPWDAPAERRRIDAIVRVFGQPVTAAPDSGRGREVIFIASLPRSGSTLVEQVLASHPQVEGANEITDLRDIIRAEAMRQRNPYPTWVPAATSPDWERLGTRYLARTMRWRERKPRFTDKNVLNWLFVGAALAMLPAAKVVLVHRDPVETCLACFRQWFEEGSLFSCNLDDMADRCIDFWRLRELWLRNHPGNVLDLAYEDLLATPEITTRRLLEFCQLPFDPACLAFHRTQRAVMSSPSAAQVRQPLRHDTARAARYGDKLDALRRRLREAGLPGATAAA